MNPITPTTSIDATPIKSVYLSIISDYDLRTAICELIDNSIDAWRAAKRSDALEVKINIDVDQQSLNIIDNAGGVSKSDLKVLVSPGSSSETPVPDPIGVFGVGSKRSVVALAERIRITTRHKNEVTHRVQYDDDWIQDPESDWTLQVQVVEDIANDSTEIELTKLRVRVEREDVEELKAHLSVTYANYLEQENIYLVVDEVLIEPMFFAQWSFNSEYPPRTFRKTLPNRQYGSVDFRITQGLTVEEGTLTGDYGVFIYCNRRLIARALRSGEVGFMTGLAGIDHHAMNLSRVIVEFDGPAKLMPWTSKKDGIYYGHPTFQSVKHDIINSVINATKWSKALKRDFGSKVEPFKTGAVVEESLPASEPIKSRLPSPPRVRRDFNENIISINRGLTLSKPYIRGLYESVIAEEIICKKKTLTQRNRMSWILLDSVVEMGCKEYRVYEDPHKIGDEALKKLTRLELQHQTSKTLMPGDPIWVRFEYNYHRRNSFIHHKADVTVPDVDVEQFRHDVRRFLVNAFGIKFSAR